MRCKPAEAKTVAAQAVGQAAAVVGVEQAADVQAGLKQVAREKSAGHEAASVVFQREAVPAAAVVMGPAVPTAVAAVLAG